MWAKVETSGAPLRSSPGARDDHCAEPFVEWAATEVQARNLPGRVADTVGNGSVV